MRVRFTVFLSGLSLFVQVSSSQVPDSLSTSSLKLLSLEQLMDIDITILSKRPERWFDVPAAVSVITGNDIQRSGASSLPEALRSADHLNVARKNARQWGISARGFNTELANKLLVLIDGRSVYTPLFSGVFWERQDYLLQDIEHIEVIGGPGGTAWGPNAVNGVINIITKEAKDSQGLYVEGGGGTDLRDFVGARFGGTLSSEVHYRIYGKYTDRSSTVFGDGTTAGDSWSMAQAGFRVDAKHLDAHMFTFQGDVYSTRENLTTGGTARVRGGNVLGRWSHTINESSELQIQVYFDKTHLYLPAQALIINSTEISPAGIFRDDLDTYDVEFQYRTRFLDRHRIVAGIGYRLTTDMVENAPSLGFFPTTLKQGLLSGFVQDEISLIDAELNLIVGLKVGKNDYTGVELEPGGRLQWYVSRTQMVWGAVSRAVRTPSRVDRDISQPVPPHLVILVGGPGFVSETVLAYELGYRSQISEISTASFSAFLNRYDNIRSTSATPGTILPFYFENFLEGKTYGFDLSIDFQLSDWWRIHTGYSLLKENLKIQSGGTDFNDARNETSDPQQQWSLGLSLDLPQNVEFSVRLRWTDLLPTHDGPTPGIVPSYVELDARLGWRATEVITLALVGQNLLKPRHPEYGFPNAARTEIQRGVYGKVGLSF